ncbi:hypothetical protein B0H16DRAFT_1476920 [Mycena metata]|uniref:Uncharacterized protein n=1 Tax=Mycena metata TaxID=1033252 RepID=A0AAD7HAX3_9AGAR|nr:hypothetical protein B0H16DRAFT_1476920 [Mycena metata]
MPTLPDGSLPIVASSYPLLQLEWYLLASAESLSLGNPYTTRPQRTSRVASGQSFEKYRDETPQSSQSLSRIIRGGWEYDSRGQIQKLMRLNDDGGLKSTMLNGAAYLRSTRATLSTTCISANLSKFG